MADGGHAQIVQQLGLKDRSKRPIEYDDGDSNVIKVRPQNGNPVPVSMLNIMSAAEKHRSRTQTMSIVEAGSLASGFTSSTVNISLKPTTVQMMASRPPLARTNSSELSLFGQGLGNKRAANQTIPARPARGWLAQKADAVRTAPDSNTSIAANQQHSTASISESVSSRQPPTSRVPPSSKTIIRPEESKQTSNQVQSYLCFKV